MSSSIFSGANFFFAFLVIVAAFFSSKRKEHHEQSGTNVESVISSKSAFSKFIQFIRRDPLDLSVIFFSVAALFCLAVSQALKGREDDVKNDKLLSLATEINKLEREAKESLQEQINYLTGAGSYPAMYLVPCYEKPSTCMQVGIIGQGRYPLRNLGWQIYIRHQNQEAFRYTPSLNSKDYITGKLTTVSEQRIRLDDNAATAITVSFSAFNGTWIQKFRFRRMEDNSYQYKTELYKYPNKDVLIYSKDFGEQKPFRVTSGGWEVPKRDPY